MKKLKRRQNLMKDNIIEANDANRMMLLTNQNKMMSLKIAFFQAQIEEYKQELFMKDKTEEEKKEILAKMNNENWDKT